ncbi:hypothetical protein GP486_001568 [Trichoglossum hirsutum]|uniref:Acyltransferase MbtK/IucB-like conserved domain-containing protein n=1 Tax=Trichoglossum hirsutum TaxID=265104 RepID=A0A9P8LGG2_9PEZI|nr:hypothetical protein GP486_001568 [Trichoglossum hirsutum]
MQVTAGVADAPGRPSRRTNVQSLILDFATHLLKSTASSHFLSCRPAPSPPVRRVSVSIDRAEISMAPYVAHLPNGQSVTVSPVFGGLFFKANSLSTHHSVFPPGWTIVIRSEDDEDDHNLFPAYDSPQSSKESLQPKKHHFHRYVGPTIKNDNLFISSISNPSSTDFIPAKSPTRQIAMMLWATLWWYFHQPEPSPQVNTSASATTPELGKPKGDWRVNIKREGVFRGRNLLQKLERMGLITSEESSVGTDPDDRSGDGWQEMFVTRRAFWQVDPRIFLFTLTPNMASPSSSRPSSPHRNDQSPAPPSDQAQANAFAASQGLWAPPLSGPFASASRLPTYFPPPPPVYTFSNGVRHPIRPKPPRQGEAFYSRFIPSLGQYISFRVASLSPKPPAYTGPIAPPAPSLSPAENLPNPTATGTGPNDVELLHNWMNNPRVSHYWGEQGPLSHQQAFLTAGLENRHSFPVIGCWDGKPFGYFEIYWVREDALGRYLDNGGDPWDRGIHGLVGEEEFRGAHRVRVWLSSLVHCCFTQDPRTQNVLLEPRVDNERFIEYLQDAGFYKEKEIAFPHKQSALMRVKREAWECPAI